MRIIESQAHRKRRPPAPRKRDRAPRRYASDFAALEPRRLPSAMIAVSAAPAPSAFVGTSTAQGAPVGAPGESPPADLTSLLSQAPGHPGPSGGPDGDGGIHQGWATPFPAPGPPPGAPGDRDRARVSLAQADVMIGGVATPEFAFADENTGRVSVVTGGRVSFSYDLGPGPAMVKLADLNGDGTPDLIVSDSSADSVLVFLGQAGSPFGTGAGRLRSFAVGADPAGITVGNVDGEPGPNSGPPDLVIADKDSDAVTILLGQGRGASWTMAPAPSVIRLPDGSAPVRTLLADLNHDGTPDLLVLNSGADDVYLYRGEGGGAFDVADPKILAVGQSPDEMFVGRFDRRPGLDLVTVNSGSNDLTFISAFASPDPSTTTYSSGGTQPDAAVAIERDGSLDLIVANGGDGRLALLQPADIGLQLAGVITRSDLPSPTAVAPGGLDGNQVDVYAATAGLDAAAILQFNLGPASTYLPAPAESAAAINAGDEQLLAQLTPFGDSTLDMVAVLWNGLDELTAGSARAPSPNTAYFARGEGQGDDGPVLATAAAEESGDLGPSPRPTPPTDPAPSFRFASGLDRGLTLARFEVDAVADLDSAEGRGDGLDARADLARPGDGLDARAVDDALSSLWSESPARPGPEPDGARKAPAGPSDPIGEMPMGMTEDRGADARSEAAPVISSTLLAARLILKASPPRPPSFRRRPARTLPIGPVGGRPPRV